MDSEIGFQWPKPEDAPLDEDLSKCVHCGLCLNACPTYIITGLEVESPRGRIHLARSVGEGRIPLSDAVQGHWDLCLQCRACEAVCPSGVPYGRIMERSRAQIAEEPPKGGFGRRVRRFVLRNVIARPRVLRAALTPVRWAANAPLRGLVQRSRLLKIVPPLARGERQLPANVAKPYRPGRVVAGADTLLLTGCVMSELFGDVHRSTIRVLERAGKRVSVPSEQVCCGALSAHDGDLDHARQQAKKNIDAFEKAGDGTIVVNSAGCGAAMKEYGDLLRDDPYAERAAAFSERVRDFSEVVAEAGGGRGELSKRVSYQDACHLAHAQRITEEPRQALGELEGCEMLDLPGSDTCCGAAGIYSFLEPEMSGQLRRRKAEQFRKHRPEVIVTANPGCQMQYEAAVREAGIAAKVQHLAEALDEGNWRPE